VRRIVSAVATQRVEFGDGLQNVVARVRAEIVAAGENRLAVGAPEERPLEPDEQRAVLQVLRDGTYARAAARVGNEDAELASQ
jgi:hypothetical protein